MTKTKKKPTKWLIRALGLFVVLLLTGAIYQAASANDQKNYPPPGELVNVDDHKMHIYCIGTGSPTVVLESGLGETMLNWHKVQAETAVLPAARSQVYCRRERSVVAFGELLVTTASKSTLSLMLC